jgi:hypothetical protein
MAGVSGWSYSHSHSPSLDAWQPLRQQRFLGGRTTWSHFWGGFLGRVIQIPPEVWNRLRMTRSVFRYWISRQTSYGSLLLSLGPLLPYLLRPVNRSGFALPWMDRRTHWSWIPAEDRRRCCSVLCCVTTWELHGITAGRGYLYPLVMTNSLLLNMAL